MASMNTKVCIVGAGVAGLKTAHTLLNDPKSKFKAEDVLILEAQDRIGGRVLTDKTSSKLGYSYDIGGAWFHDCLSNTVLQESIDSGLFVVQKDGYFDDKDITVYDKDFNNQPVPVTDLKLNRVKEELEKFIEVYYHEDLSRKDMSLLEITDVYIKRYGDRLTSEQKKYLKKMIRYFELWDGFSADKISARYSLNDHEGRNLYNLKGYSFLLDELLRKIPASQIRTNTKVNTIVRNNKHNETKLRVETDKGIVYCDYLVVTVPLSILKLPSSHPYGISWEPSLPASITEALDATCFAALGKVIFEFNDVWWDKDVEQILHLPEETGSVELSAVLNQPPQKLIYPYLLVNYEALHKKDNKKTAQGGSFVLLTQAPLTQYLEENPDKAWDYFKASFKSFVQPGRTISEPINVITTKWTTNPYIRGSYSGVEVNGSYEDMVAQLSGEIEGLGLGYSTVRFAGEHATAVGSGCIHGAYTSGEREAAWILNHYNSLKWTL
ncbi:carbohydrate-binding module 1 protein [Yamadazyma tenuis]|uniref:Diacetylspermine oxidase n=1 Tax=Candida tenuis (strain ATCC 10573 / BCRC 21748 / CBS 615 / JCM 9827 / NBRC 10315 / NRRL Y-1498 / VKM Y-70) TaxID=590646 RepID=G3AYW9_CANTC|nr:diacetylspermine oxidase [Yamadazyma tenuis ATCC 10573]XP_006684828.1 uncharacterized protein CANTEDRAFT_112827 [Yamadazyma tenuis ATCC 10573]EGV66253.1 diacetylspermine oxidase [Yamadazyma tenuis ATCC 10573]EGV66254.1 hypothetical protein CANTEDRAFT_112827 [Yamadazyma tenuis ATCC 10573]WEJ95717.1 carbohydrate-binding module 1 protein [Yamadazyma tenuis]